jgi:hypothetical protein
MMCGIGHIVLDLLAALDVECGRYPSGRSSALCCHAHTPPAVIHRWVGGEGLILSRLRFCRGVIKVPEVEVQMQRLRRVDLQTSAVVLSSEVIIEAY